MGTASLEARLIQQLITTREAVLYEIIMDLHKAYEALDQYRCLEILLTYGVGPRAFNNIRIYWVRISMVVRSEVYYGPPFKLYGGVTQEDPCPSQSSTG